MTVQEFKRQLKDDRIYQVQQWIRKNILNKLSKEMLETLINDRVYEIRLKVAEFLEDENLLLKMLENKKRVSNKLPSTDVSTFIRIVCTNPNFSKKNILKFFENDENVREKIGDFSLSSCLNKLDEKDSEWVIKNFSNHKNQKIKILCSFSKDPNQVISWLKNEKDDRQIENILVDRLDRLSVEDKNKVYLKYIDVINIFRMNDKFYHGLKTILYSKLFNDDSFGYRGILTIDNIPFEGFMTNKKLDIKIFQTVFKYILIELRYNKHMITSKQTKNIIACYKISHEELDEIGSLFKDKKENIIFLRNVIEPLSLNPYVSDGFFEHYLSVTKIEKRELNKLFSKSIENNRDFIKNMISLNNVDLRDIFIESYSDVRFPDWFEKFLKKEILKTQVRRYGRENKNFLFVNEFFDTTKISKEIRMIVGKEYFDKNKIFDWLFDVDDISKEDQELIWLDKNVFEVDIPDRYSTNFYRKIKGQILEGEYGGYFGAKFFQETGDKRFLSNEMNDVFLL